MTASWTVTDANDASLTAYKALRLAQDHITLTTDQALAEMFLICTRVHHHGNFFNQ